jgi:hypothetical protein
MMSGQAPDISVHILSRGAKIPQDFFDLISENPTLVFSPMPIKIKKLKRGKVICPPNNISKWNEMEILHKKNIPSPKSMLVQKFEDIKSVDMGDEFIIKPLKGLQGRGVNLITRQNFKNWSEFDFITSKSNNGGIIVQQFLDTGENPYKYRAFTVLGKVIYCIRSEAVDVLARNTLSHSKYGVPAADGAGDLMQFLADDEDVIDFAQFTYNELGISPVMGIDIIRDKLTNKLYVNELNPCGWTWNLSSEYGLKRQRRFGTPYYSQFNALNIIMEQLIKEVRQSAV